MCGIAGYLNLNNSPASPVIIRQMTDAIEHRGPDDEGHWIEGNIAIGHRRLSIIDTSPAGHQPMMSADQRYVLSYNGEIYNFKELRSDLQSKGYQFNSKSDSEVVLNALSHWGSDALLKFNGMFAIAFWDRKTKSLLLARDRYGIKPLYYTNANQQISFASEQKAIWAIPNYTRRLDKEALLEYFTFQNIFTDKTLENEIKVLPAGYFATLDFAVSAPKIKTRQYWDFDFSEEEQNLTKSEYIEEMDYLMNQAVSRQMVSDVEVGSYLSGGIDSGSISALASKHTSYLKTFTCGFDLSSASGIELNYDERQKAEYMSYLFKTEHYEMVLKSGDMERCMATLVRHIEEPRVGQSYPNLYASKLASKFVKVVLSGTGGDELFGGYPWRYYRAAVNTSFDDYINKYYAFWQRLLNRQELSSVFAPIWNDVKHVSTEDIFRGVFKLANDPVDSAERYINQSLYFECKTFLSGLLSVEDKLSMSNSLEARIPFLDNDLVTFAMKCPVSLKLKNLNDVVRMNENTQGNKRQIHYQKTKEGKQILRDTMSQYLPQETVIEVKQGFSGPDGSWYRGESIDYVEQKLVSGSANIYELLDYASTTSLIKEHLSGKQNRRLLIWSLLFLEEYIEQS